MEFIMRRYPVREVMLVIRTVSWPPCMSHVTVWEGEAQPGPPPLRQMELIIYFLHFPPPPPPPISSDHEVPSYFHICIIKVSFTFHIQHRTKVAGQTCTWWVFKKRADSFISGYITFEYALVNYFW